MELILDKKGSIFKSLLALDHSFGKGDPNDYHHPLATQPPLGVMIDCQA